MADFSIQLGEANSRLKNLDINNDGKIDKLDSKAAKDSGKSDILKQINDLAGIDEEPVIEEQSSNTPKTQEELGQTTAVGGANTPKTLEELGETTAVGGAEEGEESKEVDPAVLEKIKGIGSSSSLAEIDEAIGVLKTYIDQLDGEIAKLDEELGVLQDSYDVKLKEKETNEARYEALAQKLDKETDTLNLEIKNAEGKAESQAQVQHQSVRDAVKRANVNFNGQQEGEDKPLNGFIQTELAGIPEMSGIDNTIMNSMAGRIAMVAMEMDTVGKQIESNIADLNQIKTDMDGKQSIRNTKSAQRDGAKTKMDELNTLKEQKQAEEAAKAAAAAKCDPIGFNDKTGNRFDFVVDRNSDGKFNGANEFLGAQDQWKEMQALDKNNDGVVKNDELKGVKLLKTDQNGKQSFVEASSVNLEIDLSTYQKAKEGTMKGAGQELLGTFNATVNGEQLAGYNTLDDMSYLNSEYGKSYDKSFGGSEQTKATGSDAIRTAKSHLQFGSKVDTAEILKSAFMSVNASSDYTKGLAESVSSDKTNAAMVDEQARTGEKKETKAQPKEAPKQTQQAEQENNPFKKQKAE